MSDELIYSKRGVSASKEDVHHAIKHLDKGLYPNAFCKILPDLVAGDEDYCNIMHADTAGTKTSLAYVYWKETADEEVWTNIVQDAIVMNIDDMACVGCVNNIILSSTIGRNKNLIPGSALARIIAGTSIFIDKMKALGIDIHLSGGETADVGDIVRTIDIGFTTFARMPKSKLIINRIQPGDVIVGIASFGQATYENSYNSGIGSNGLTSARHDLISKSIGKKYPESYDNNTPEDVVYIGKNELNDEMVVPGFTTSSLGKLLLSPTRTYIPIVSKILDEKLNIHGIIHCTGGGQTKVMKFVDKRKIIKDNLFPIPFIFKKIENETTVSRKEMYQVFNMGHRMEIYTDKYSAEKIIKIVRAFNVDAQIIGRVEDSLTNELIIADEKGEYNYQ